ncbi:SWIM zinc finger family protein [Glaciecola sp. 1036]|uniref:SWIM zinc finger family protein n=1 Tax=Alteromonadaceae TaxID=72275 RepID=UPI003D05D15C
MSSNINAIIQRLAGQSAYEKGVALFRENAVINFRNENNKIIAQVQGTYVYDVSLTILSDSFDGGCSCPASEGFDFCKHCVATVLHYEEQQEKYQILLNGGPADRVKGYLDSLTEGEAKQHLYSYIKSNSEELDKWVLFADIALDSFDIKQFRKRIIKALPLRDLWRYDQVRNYFDKARAQLSILFEVMDRLEAMQAVELAEFMLARYDKIVERVDDSGGYRFGVYYLIEKQFIKSFQRLTIEDEKKAQILMGLYDSEYLHIDFGDVGKKFIDSTSSPLAIAFYGKLEKRIETIKKDKTQSVSSNIYQQMVHSLARYAYVRGDYDKSASWLASIAKTFSDGFTIIEDLLQANQFKLACKYLKNAKTLAKHKDDIDKLNRCQLNVNLNLNDLPAALTVAWDLFCSTLSTEDFERVANINKELGFEKEDLYSKAESEIKKSFKSNVPDHLKNYAPLIEFYIATKQYQKASDLVENHELPEYQLHELAFVCVQNNLAEKGVELYKKLITHFVLKGQNKDYQFALDLLLELEENENYLPNKRQSLRQIVTELMSTHTNKPTFTKLLELNFSEL